MICTLCGKEIKKTDSLYCGYCNAVFHRACIMDHFYYNRFCPSCKKNLSYLDMRYGEPARQREPVKEYTEVAQEYVPQTVRKPLWPPQKEVPLFKTSPAVQPEYTKTSPAVQPEYTVRAEYVYERKPKKGLFTQVRGFIFAKPGESASTYGRFRHNRKGMLGVYMLIAAVSIAILAPVLILYDPVTYLAEEDEYVNHPPTWKYPMGTDVFGRDIYSQTVWGFRSAMMLALPSALLIAVIGTVVGLVSGYYGKYVDAVLQRISLAFLVWPSVPLVALIVFSWGGSQAQLAIIVGVAFSLWPTTARAIRAEVLSLKTRTFIDSARISGASSRRIVFRHILPNVIHITFVYMTIAVASALVLEATFNFLGLSSPAVVTWGQMLSFAYHSTTARFGVGGFVSWWAVLPPGLAIAYMVFSFFLISTGLRESMRAAVRF